ncbi:mitochondrial amidoxime-reducing component 1 isoform X13 [Vicugna pacos]|uniref:Mitochondrial amidoxime-reducing component 1 isoform X13 n=1 Tax=Vicugna pacos TaxID=30538 RepID=A0ABM5C832_VICPA
MGAAGSSVLARLGLPGRPRPGWLAVAALGLAAVALGAVAWRRARPRRRRRLQQVGTVAQLCIYPIKSCKGVSVSAAECTALGLRSGHLRDRFWMVINKMGNMVTARQEPRLVLISPTCEGDTLTLSAAYTRDLQLPIQTPTTNAVHKCRVHGLEIEGRDCGEAAAQWITSFLKTQPYRLVHFEPHMRPRNSHQIEDVFRPTDQVVYADASPFLILSEASLADLNSRLEKKVKATNFRPNILISGCGVYAESHPSPLRNPWNFFKSPDEKPPTLEVCSHRQTRKSSLSSPKPLCAVPVPLRTRLVLFQFFLSPRVCQIDTFLMLEF